ncbi:MAG: hypothetical protein ROZ64_17015 [Burkholderiaceae bacterium]|jgi:ABC-type transporter Mla subunit MlaD|nr:hypothetical protein [Burkholderiaceae bacterium]
MDAQQTMSQGDGEIRHLVDAARDALSDEMVGRLSDTVANGISLLDRFTRGGADRLVELVQQLDRLERSGGVQKLVDSLPTLVEGVARLQVLLDAVDAAAKRTSELPASAGGVRAALALVREPQFQDTMRFLLAVGEELRRARGAPAAH